MSSEILLEAGIGETRAALVTDDRIVEMHVERDGDGPHAGDVIPARLATILVPGRRGIAATDQGDILVAPLPRGLAEGGRFLVEVTREALPEPGRPRMPKGQATDLGIRRGPDLVTRLAMLGLPIRDVVAHGPDLLEQAGWSEIVEEARSGLIAFDGGILTVSLTPAMTVIDVDGPGAAAELALAAARAAAQAIRRHGLAGSIGIDFPTLADKSARQTIATAFDAVLPMPFERTAVNGFGFLQIVRRRQRPSLPERVQGAPVECAALALLRRAEREPGTGPRTLVSAPAVTAWLAARADLTEELARRTGAPVALRADPALAIETGHADVRPA